MGRDHWKSTPYVYFICLNLQKGVNTSFGQNRLQYRVITSIGTFSIYLWMILLSCRYLQPIRIWRLLHEEYSLKHFHFHKKRYWRISNNQTSSISPKTEPVWRENLIDLVNKISGFRLRDSFPPLYQLTEASMPGDVYLCVMVNIQNISLTRFWKKWRTVKMMRSL